MCPIPNEFYQYLAQKGYTNICRGYSFEGSFVIPQVKIDTCELSNNEKYFIISYEQIKAQFDPANQGLPLNRDPTSTVNKIFDMTGGDRIYKHSSKYYNKGTYDPNAKVFGNDSIFSRSHPERYVTDTQLGSASKYNMWVNQKGVFKMDDIPIPKITTPATGHNYGPSIPNDVLSKCFTNYLIGSFIKGEGYENIEFPLNGSVSSMLKDAGIVNDALTEFYKLNKGKKSNLQTFSDQINGTTLKNNALSIVVNGIGHPETLIGSAFIMVSPYNDKELLVKVFDIKSIYSGDYVKETKMFGINSGLPMSLVRDSTKNGNRYTNTSQTYSFTLPIDSKRLQDGK